METTNPVIPGRFLTCSGVVFDILNPTEAMIKIEDIACSLSKVCRSGGQLNDFFSVAQHSIIVTAMAPDDLKGISLLHDSTESYIGDVIKPLKIVIESIYGPIEEKLGRLIFKKYKLDYSRLPEIKQYDNLALELEQEYFQHGDATNWDKVMKELKLYNKAMYYPTAYEEFLKCFNKYVIKDGTKPAQTRLF